MELLSHEQNTNLFLMHWIWGSFKQLLASADVLVLYLVFKSTKICQHFSHHQLISFFGKILLSNILLWLKIWPNILVKITKSTLIFLIKFLCFEKFQIKNARTYYEWWLVVVRVWSEWETVPYEALRKIPFPVCLYGGNLQVSQILYSPYLIHLIYNSATLCNEESVYPTPVCQSAAI